MNALPGGRNKESEEVAFLSECHRTQNRRMDVVSILCSESFFDAAERPALDVWNAFYHESWLGNAGMIKGNDIMSALRDHLAKLQRGLCCYCSQPLLKGGYARPIEHVLSRTDYPRFSLYFWNLAVACERCNRIKSAKGGGVFPRGLLDYPKFSEFTSIYHPRFHEHGLHVRFTTTATNDFRFTIYLGLSEQGRHLVETVLREAALEEALESNNPAVNDSMNLIRTFLGTQDQRARDKIADFEKALVNVIVTQAACMR